MRVVLAEKPSVARDIARTLGANARHDGYFEGNGYQVTWALGHLVMLQEPHDYDPSLRRWSLATLPIVPERFGLKVITDGGARKQFGVVKRLFRQADELICATDAGREGELIFRYILELTGARAPVQRLWLNALTDQAIRDGFRHLRPAREFDSLYHAARCRSEADWIVGLNATRAYTVRHGGGHLWSAGRVQTPVLALIVQRDDEIRTFRPEPFWELLTKYRQVEFRCQLGDESPEPRRPEPPRPATGATGGAPGYVPPRFKTAAAAEAVLQRVSGQPFVVERIERKQEKVLPPQLYDLTELQRDMNRRFGLSAADTLNAAQKLYEGKFITYPRTDSRYLTKSLEPTVVNVLRSLAAAWPKEIRRLDLNALNFTSRIVNDAKVTDHHAIIPTGNVPENLGGRERKVYDAIVTRLIAVFYPPCLKDVTTVHGRSADVPFRARGVRVVDPGWTILYPKPAPRDAKRRPRGDEDGDDSGRDEAATQELPDFVVGERGPHEPFVRAGQTKPPPHFTENSLLGAMETAGQLVDEDTLREALKERGLGTPATRAAIIETLLDRAYIERERKSLRATGLGRYLIALIRDRRLKSASLTGEWEAQLKQIEAGRLDPRRFMAAIVDYARGLVRFDDALPDGEQLGPCPRCGREVIQGKRAYGCSGWRDGCAFVLEPTYGERTLSRDEVRALLHWGALPQPESADGGAVIVHLAPNGTLLETPVPAPRTDRRRGQKAGRSGGESSGKAFGKRRGSSRRPHAKARPSTIREDENAMPEADTPQSTGARRSTRGTSERKPASGRWPKRSVRGSRKSGKSTGSARAVRSEDAAGAPGLGVCPLCGASVEEQPRSFGCSKWRDGCRFAIWKTIAGKKITESLVRQLLQQGQTDTLAGFQSRSGREFSARLTLTDGNVTLDFEGA